MMQLLVQRSIHAKIRSSTVITVKYTVKMAFLMSHSRSPIAKTIPGSNVMRNTRFEVLRTSGALGAELQGIDLSGSLDREDAADIRQALNEHGVIFFRDQRLSPEQHIAFAEA